MAYVTLGVVGVERSTSETVTRTLNKRKSGRRSKGEAHRAEPTSGLRFRGKAPKEANGEAQRAEPKFVTERRSPLGRADKPIFGGI